MDAFCQKQRRGFEIPVVLKYINDEVLPTVYPDAFDAAAEVFLPPPFLSLPLSCTKTENIKYLVLLRSEIYSLTCVLSVSPVCPLGVSLSLCVFFLEPLLRYLSHLGQAFPRFTVSKSVAYTIMTKIGWKFKTKGKGVFVDGHERDDVVKYRAAFIKRWFEEYAPHFDFESWLGVGDAAAGAAAEAVQGALLPMQEGEKEDEYTIVPMFHDESTFYASDGRTRMWLPGSSAKGHNILTKKGLGKAFMISGFMCPCHPYLLQHQPDDSTPTLPRVPLNPDEDKNGEPEHNCPCGKADGARAMIRCVTCNGWYHVTCVKLTVKEAKRKKVAGEPYNCVT